MSTVIDSKVVEMKFDNSKFESNVKTTMSTLDKLKLSLAKISGKHASLDVDTSGTNKGILSVGNAVDSVSSKFTALEAVAFGALAKIGQQALVAGEQLIKSLSVDNIAAGWSKYDEKTSSVQTLVNSTGKSVDEINKYLDQLMWYSDETSYSFTEMTSALAQMTSTGGDIDKLIPAITGIANATAFAGKSGEAFNHTIRNITQSYNAGFLQLMDWKSLNLAGTSSKQLTEELIKAAEEIGTVKKGMLTLENFAENLRYKFITTDVMDLAFSRFSAMSEEAYKLVQAGKFDTASEAIEAISDNFDELSKRAFQSAQEAKTFKEAIDATKDAVSSGWMETFEIIFGNYEQAKELWTDIANRMWDFFAGGAGARNEKLSEILGNSWDTVTEKIKESGIETEEFEKRFEEMLVKNGINVDAVKREWGTFGDWIAQSDGRYNHFIKDTLSNMAFSMTDVGEEFKVTAEDAKKFDEIIEKIASGKYKKAIDAEKELTKIGFGGAQAQEMLNNFYSTGATNVLSLRYEAGKLKDTILDLSKAQVSSYGYTEDQIAALKELSIEARDDNSALGELINTINRPSGRELLIGSLMNVLDSFEAVVSTVKEAFAEIFPPAATLSIYNVIKAINELTEKMKNFLTNEKNADKLKRTFKGLFAVLDIVKIVFTDIGQILLSIIQPLFGKTNNSVLDFTASLGDNLVAIRDWIKANDKVGAITAWLSNKVEKAVTTFKNLTKEGGALNKVYKTMSGHLAKIKDSFAEWLNGLIEAEDKPKYIIDSLISAFEDNIPKFKEAAEKAITAIIETLQDDIDNGKFNEAGKAALDSFINGFNEDGEDSVLTAFKELGQKLLDKAKKLPWEKIFALGLSLALIKVLSTMGFYINKITSMLSPLKGILTNASEVLSSISGMFKNIGKAIKKEATGDMALKFAEAIAIIVGCIVALALVAKEDAAAAWTATGIIATIIATFALALIALNVSMGLLTNLNPAGYISQVLAYVALIGSLTIFISAIAGVIALISKAGDLTQGLWVVSGIFIALIGIIALIAFLAPKLEEGTWAIGALSVFIKSLGVFMLETAVSMRLIGSMDKDAFERASGFFAGMMAFILILMVVAMAMKDIPREMDYFGKGMAAIGAAMILAAVAMKIIGSMDTEALKKGYVFLVTMGIFIGVMMVLTKKIAWQKAMVNFGKMMIQLGAALILTAIAMKIMGNLSGKEILQGISFIFAFMIFTQAMAKVTATGGKTVLSFSKMMMSLGVALLLMSISVKLLGSMKAEELKKGELAVLGLALIMRLLIKSFKGFDKEAPKIAASLIACGICIGIMALVTFLIGQVSPETLAKGLVAVGILSVFLALLIRSTKGLENNKQLIENFIAIGVLIAALAAIVLLLSILEPEEALASAGALAMVMTALIGLVAVASKAKYNEGAWKSFLAIGILLAEITGILLLLSNFGNVEALIPSAVAIGLVLLALSASMLILDKIKGVSAESLIALSIMGLIVFEIGIILGLLSGMGLEISIEQAMALGILIDLLSVAMIALAAAGSMGPGVWAGIGAFETFIVATTAVVTGIGALFKEFDSLQGYLDTGIVALTKVGEAIGGFFGGIVAGFGNELLTLLPNAGDALTAFYVKALPFIMGMATLPPGVTEGAEALASALLKITAGEALNALINAFFGEEVMSGEQLEKSFTAIGSALKAFSTSVSGFSDDDVEAISKAAKAAESLTSFISNLPAEGGWKQKILGEQDLGKFSTNLKSFAYALQVFSEKAKEIDADAITNAANAAMGLADFANALPEYTNGTLKGFVMGDKQNIQEFGKMLGALADGLITFSQKSADISPDEIKKSAEAAEDLATLANNLPETGGKFGEWFGADHIDIGTFGDQLEDLADGLVELSESGEGINSQSMGRVLDAVEKLAAIAVSLAGADFSVFGSDSISKLGEELPGLGQSLVSFGTSVYQLSASTSNIGYALDNISKVADIVLQMQGIDYNYIYSFKDALNSLSQFDMKGLINTFSVEGVDNIGKAGKQLMSSLQEGIVKSAEDVKKTTGIIMTAILNTVHTKYEDMRTSGYNLIDNLRAGMRLCQDSVKNTAREIALSASKAINGTYSYFVSAGKHLTAGLNEGMKNGEGEVLDAAASLASNMVTAMKTNLKIESPSRIAAEIGKFFDLGLVMGMENYSDKIYSTAVELSNKTLEGISSSIDQIYEIIDGDLNPVITPMINLDYVKKGVNDINSMFNAKTLNASSELQNGADVDSSGTNISFTQINNSPKALSRIEIYRQTRNQIAQLKGALN